MRLGLARFLDRALGEVNQRSWFTYQRTMGYSSLEAGERTIRIPIGLGAGRDNLRPAETKLIRIIRKLYDTGRVGTFADIGANSGQSLLSLIYSDVAGIRYLGFEPQLSAALCVSELLRLNGIEGQVVAAALSDRNGVSVLRSTAGQSDVGASLSPSSPRVAFGETLTAVPTLRGDDVFDEPLFLLKLDCEGAESQVLEGMPLTLKHGAPIYFELLGAAPYLTGEYSREWVGGVPFLGERFSDEAFDQLSNVVSVHSSPRPVGVCESCF